MTKTIVDLREVREVLAQWELVRRHLAQRKIKGFHVTLIDEDEAEAVYFGGIYRDDSQAAVRALLKASARRTLSEDEPPLFQASQL